MSASQQTTSYDLHKAATLSFSPQVEEALRIGCVASAASQADSDQLSFREKCAVLEGDGIGDRVGSGSDIQGPRNTQIPIVIIESEDVYRAKSRIHGSSGEIAKRLRRDSRRLRGGVLQSRVLSHARTTSAPGNQNASPTDNSGAEKAVQKDEHFTRLNRLQSRAQEDAAHMGETQAMECDDQVRKL